MDSLVCSPLQIYYAIGTDSSYWAVRSALSAVVGALRLKEYSWHINLRLSGS